MNILFVCSGNTCRSPMAEAILEDLVDKSNILHSGLVCVKSCGTFAAQDASATPKAIRIMEKMGLDIKKHKSAQFDDELADWADLILTMQASHLEEIETMAPDAMDKTHTILGYINGVFGIPFDDYDVLDPYGEDIQDYEKCANTLLCANQKLEKILEQIQN